VLRQKLSRGQVVVRLANLRRAGRHGGLRRRPSISRQLLTLGHEVKLVPRQLVKPFLKGVGTSGKMRESAYGT
jgi:transposase